MQTSTLLLAAVALGLAACSGAHPLDRDGTVQVTDDSPGPLFAAAAAITTPQQRSSANLSIVLTEAGQPAKHAFVDVRVIPSTALTLRSTDGSCVDDGGFFRCTANAQGMARFAVDANTQWSSPTPAIVEVVWSDKTSDHPISVLPPGLPKSTQSLTLTVGGLAAGQTQRIPPTFSLLSCKAQTLDPKGTWPASPRQRPLRVHANPPAGDPTSILNAPVVIESPSTEVEFSVLPDCKMRNSTLAVTLDASGDSTPGYACFSALGGLIPIQAASGELGSVDTSRRQIQVDGEPQFLSVTAVNPEGHLGQTLNLFQIVARDALGQRVAISVTASASGTGTVQLTQSTFLLTDDSNPQPTLVNVLPTATGDVRLHVAPDLVPNLGCDSPTVSIVP